MKLDTDYQVQVIQTKYWCFLFMVSAETVETL